MISASKTIRLPGFKWIVGLWFALLLGLGLFVMPASVHAALIEQFGLAGVLPGPVAERALLAGGAALVGLALGLVIALRIVALVAAPAEDEAEAGAEDATDPLWLDRDPGSQAEPERQAAPTRRRTFNPREDIGEAGIAPQREADDGPAGLASERPVADISAEAPPQGADDAPAAPEDAPAPAAGSASDPGSSPDSSSKPATGPSEAATGDLSLAQLTARLEAALAACKAAPPHSGTVGADTEPVIAFLRREAQRGETEAVAGVGDDDPQAALQQALAKLSRLDQSR